MPATGERLASIGHSGIIRGRPMGGLEYAQWLLENNAVYAKAHRSNKKEYIMDILQLRNGMRTLRFHTVPTIHEETIGHHSGNVALLCLWLKPDASADLLRAALLHDLAEQFTGDVPAPAKWSSQNLDNALSELEEKHLRYMGVYMPMLTQPWVGNLTEQDCLKAADMLDLVLRCTEERLMGNKQMWRVIERGWDYLYGMNLGDRVWPKIDQLIAEAADET